MKKKIRITAVILLMTVSLSCFVPLTKHVEAEDDIPVHHGPDLQLTFILSKTTNIGTGDDVPYTVVVRNIGDEPAEGCDIWAWFGDFEPYEDIADMYGPHRGSNSLVPGETCVFDRDEYGIVKFIAPLTPGTYQFCGLIDWGQEHEPDDIFLENNKCSYIITVVDGSEPEPQPILIGPQISYLD